MSSLAESRIARLQEFHHRQLQGQDHDRRPDRFNGPHSLLTHVGATEWIGRSTFRVTPQAHEQLIEVNVPVKTNSSPRFNLFL